MRELLQRGAERVRRFFVKRLWASSFPADVPHLGIAVRAGNVELLGPLQAALTLLSQRDPRTLTRLRSCCEGILVADVTPGAQASFDDALRLIILRPTSLEFPATRIAMTIAHEVMHAWLGRRDNLYRTERICASAEIATGRRVGATPALLDDVVRRRSNLEGVYSPAALRRRRLADLETKPAWFRVIARPFV